MEFDDVILGRRSIRGYKPDPVPRALIQEILGLAMRAPSSMNTQPWNFYVITGEPLERIRLGNTTRMAAGVPQSREFRTGPPFAGPADRRGQAIVCRHGNPSGRPDEAAGLGDARLPAIRCARVHHRHLRPGARWQRRHAVRLRGGDHGARERRLVAGPGLRDQQPGDHAVARGARARRHCRRSGDHEERCTRMADETFAANAVVSERKSVAEAAVFVGFDV
jgi:nitroreductase